MRLSVDKEDPGYRVDAVFHEAYLDGVKLNYCVTADEERGEAIVCKVRDGRLHTDGDSVLREMVYGKIEIRRIADPENL